MQSARFELVIVDAPNLRVEDFKDFWAQGEVSCYCQPSPASLFLPACTAFV